jgi:hypothetical protein
MSGVVQLTFLAWCAFAAAFSVSLPFVYPIARPRLLALEPEARSRALTLLAAAPAAFATTLTAACHLPSLVMRAAGLTDHCAHHDEVHAHFCWVHPSAGNTTGWGLAAGSALALSLLVLPECLRLARECRSAGRFADAARELPIAFTIGALRPRAVIGTALAAALSPSLLSAVAAHEAAHVDRRDNLRKGFASITARLLPGRARTMILGDLDLACEEACDGRAAAATGDPLVVAEAILAAERLARGIWIPRTASSFHASPLEARVEALLRRSMSADRGSPPASRWGWLLLACSSIVAAVPLHDALEDVVALLGH